MRDEGAGRGWTRREFGRAVAVGAGVVAVGAGAAPGIESPTDSPLAEFCRSLRPEQREALILPVDDPRRAMVQNDWAVVPARIADLTLAQQDLALALIRRACTLEGFDRLTRARLDDSGGWKHDHLAVFGSPAGPIEWLVSGRHLTLRGSAAGAITGGPLFWGHSATGPGTLGHDQGEAAGAFFRGLAPDQQVRALADGLPLGDLPSPSPAARALVASLAAPFARFEVGSVRAILDGAVGLGSVRWQGFRAAGEAVDASPRIWRLVGAGWSWSFHGLPHAHSWFDAA